jgi:hypothetical protein
MRGDPGQRGEEGRFTMAVTKTRVKKTAVKQGARKVVAAKKAGTKKTAKKGPARRRLPAAPAMAAVTTVKVVNMIPKSLSGEVNQDSEPHLLVNPAHPLQIGATAFTPNPGGGAFGPVYKSFDGGNTWRLDPIIPSSPGSQTGTFDQTTSFGGDGKNYYGGIIRDPTQDTEFLRTSAFATPTAMTVLASRSGPNVIDQPFTHATTVGSGADAGLDRVYIGDNDLNALPATATIDECLDGKAAAPVFNSVRVESRATSGQDGAQIRPVAHADGTVYSAFYGWRSATGNFQLNTYQITSADLVVLRDDNWGKGPMPFAALKDPLDGNVGLRVVQGINFPFNITGTPAGGQERIGGSISIAVDPRNSSTVWVAWGDSQPGSLLTLHVRRSTDRGKTWSNGDLLTVADATNAALAITQNGVVGLLSQSFGDGSEWSTTLNFTVNGAQWSQLVLAQTLASIPALIFDPYLGDYDHMVAVGDSFYGVFCANNTPDNNNFPRGVTYQRNADFTGKKLLALDGKTAVAVSIDPFFFKVTPDPCQPLQDAVNTTEREILQLTEILNNPNAPGALRAFARRVLPGLQRQLPLLQAQFKTCRAQNP